MKTPMQEHIEWLKKEWKKLESVGELGIALHIGDCIEHAESMLEKEEEVMCYFAKKWDMELGDVKIRSAESCFDETFKTKER
jgi:hypothetical protein